MVAFLNVAGRAGTVALQNVAGMADTHVTVAGNNITVPQNCNKILGVFAETEATAGSITNQVVLNSPSLRSRTVLELANWNNNGAIAAATQIPDQNAPFNDFKEAPVRLMPGEALQCQTAVDVAAVAEAPVVIVWLTDGNIYNMPADVQIETVFMDAAAAAVINVWSPVAPVFRQALRAGTYAVVGMKAVGISMTAARLVVGNQGGRPRCLAANNAVASPGDCPDQARGLFRYGRLGVWGTFTNANPPNVEVLCSIADAAANMHFALDIVKIA